MPGYRVADFHIPYSRTRQNPDTESKGSEYPPEPPHAPAHPTTKERKPPPGTGLERQCHRDPSPRPVQPARTTQASASAITSASTAITRYSCPPLVSPHQRLPHPQQPPRSIAHRPHRQPETSPMSRYSPAHPYRHQHPTKGVIEQSPQLVRAGSTANLHRADSPGEVLKQCISLFLRIAGYAQIARRYWRFGRLI